MCTDKVTPNMLRSVKETVDAIYDYLIPHPDGITMAARDYGKRGARICTELVKRGIITKSYVSVGRKGVCIKYKWVATMGPTKVLYGSIAQKLHDEQKRWNEVQQKKKAKEAAKKTDEPAASVEPVIAEHVEPTESLFNPIEEQVIQREYWETVDMNAIPIQIMWDNMKSRGCSIEDGQLTLTEVKVIKTVLS